MTATDSRIAAAALAFGVAISMFAPSAAAQHCEVIGCWRECGWIPGRGHCCRTVCRKRCFHPLPRYEPSPVYVRAPERQSQPRYVSPVQHWQPSPEPVRAAQQQVDPWGFLIVLGGAACVVLLIIAAAPSERAAINAMHKQTDAAHADAAQAKTLATRAVSTADEIDSFISARLDEAYRAGRNTMPETGHD